MSASASSGSALRPVSAPETDHAAIIVACRRRDTHQAAVLVEDSFVRLGAQMTIVMKEAEHGAGDA